MDREWNIDDQLQNVKWKRFATGLHEPLGLKIVNEKIFTVGDNQITLFHDFNNDGEADFLENFNNDWDATEGFHAFCFDLQTDPKETSISVWAVRYGRAEEGLSGLADIMDVS